MDTSSVLCASSAAVAAGVACSCDAGGAGGVVFEAGTEAGGAPLTTLGAPLATRGFVGDAWGASAGTARGAALDGGRAAGAGRASAPGRLAGTRGVGDVGAALVSLACFCMERRRCTSPSKSSRRLCASSARGGAAGRGRAAAPRGGSVVLTFTSKSAKSESTSGLRVAAVAGADGAALLVSRSLISPCCGENEAGVVRPPAGVPPRDAAELALATSLREAQVMWYTSVGRAGAPALAHGRVAKRRNDSDDSGAESDAEMAAFAPPVRSSPGPSALPASSFSHARKRRHLDQEMRDHMCGMRLDDAPRTVSDACPDTPDEDMSGTSYEIAPDRIYVHTLEDSDDESVASQPSSSYEVHPVVAQRLEAEARAAQARTPSRWLTAANERPPTQSLVLWRPPSWSIPPDKVSDPPTRTPRSLDDVEMADAGEGP